ncbi:hypothetical protein PUNSTDRAFT_25677, partial [Punctularia strigosozonata HHB-11173 SS5]|uniref:uncharacterized protein n=1 Tax=Punctularia strigosozonata (strain HHB-11173) TaxID=741275 RepID=UPI0004416CB1
FLGASGPAIDAPVTVETTPADYRLMIPLVGFNREMMTLSARRNRILHILADSWAPGGGHFERRISFGYDADIPRVRAEYDGELLTVTVPRR